MRPSDAAPLGGVGGGGPDYEGEVRRARLENMEKVRSSVIAGEHDEKLEEKIASFCRAFGFAREEVVAEIRRSRVAAAKFAIDPKRQNIYERLAGDYIRGLPGVNEFSKLSGRRELWVKDGGVLSRSEVDGEAEKPIAKSIDFSWRFGGLRFLASHKYTTEAGGAQISAYKDLRLFLEHCADSREPGLRFVAIADGPLYGGMNGMAGVTRLENLRRIARAGSGAALACRIGELPGEMARAAAQTAAGISRNSNK